MWMLLFRKRSDSEESLADDYGGPLLANISNCNNLIKHTYGFLMNGRCDESDDDFVIDFQANNTHKDIYLRLRFCVSTQSLSRNSRIRGEWGREETALENKFRLVKCKQFEIEVFFTDHFVFAAVDGIHVAKFSHRVEDYTSVHTIQLRGDIKNFLLRHQCVSSYPSKIRSTPHMVYLRGRYAKTANIEDIESDNGSKALSNNVEKFLPLPFHAIFGLGFLREGYSVIVKGRITDNPDTITVALQEGQNIWPEPNTLLNIQYRFHVHGEEGKNTLIGINTFSNGIWEKEFVSGRPNSLQPGSNFYLRIKRGAVSFHIYMNRELLHKVMYVMHPKHVDTCRVQGDIQLFDVIIESN